MAAMQRVRGRPGREAAVKKTPQKSRRATEKVFLQWPVASEGRRKWVAAAGA